MVLNCTGEIYFIAVNSTTDIWIKCRNLIPLNYDYYLYTEKMVIGGEATVPGSEEQI